MTSCKVANGPRQNLIRRPLEEKLAVFIGLCYR